MNKYLIMYGQDGSYFIADAPTVLDAVFAFAKYVGALSKPSFEKAIRAMETTAEIVELFNHFADGYDEIQTIYIIGETVYSDSKE